MTFDHYISELLKDHDCVIIPDFGGFVGNYASARINPVNHRIDPPYRKISFNKLLVHNDGLLAAYVAQKEEEKFERALARIKNYAVYLKSELDSHHRIDIEKVGVLYKQADGTFRFEQFKQAQFFADGFGLESFYSKPIVHFAPKKIEIEPKATPIQPIEAAKPVNETKAEVKEKVVVQLIPEESPQKVEPALRRRYWPAVAAAIALPVIGYIAWLSMGTTVFTTKQSFHYSDLNPFTEKICPEYVVRSDVFSAEALGSDLKMELPEKESYFEIYSGENRDKTLVVSLEEKVEHTSKLAELATTDLVYHVIGGCFSDESNAEGMVSKYLNLGSNASIIDKKGTLNRVSIGSYATKKEALQALTSFRNEIPNAWLLHK